MKKKWDINYKVLYNYRRGGWTILAFKLYIIK